MQLLESFSVEVTVTPEELAELLRDKESLLADITGYPSSVVKVELNGGLITISASAVTNEVKGNA